MISVLKHFHFTQQLWYFLIRICNDVWAVIYVVVFLARFNGVPAEERLHWRSFLVKLGAENLKGAKNEELLVACHKYVSPFSPLFSISGSAVEGSKIWSLLVGGFNNLLKYLEPDCVNGQNFNFD